MRNGLGPPLPGPLGRLPVGLTVPWPGFWFVGAVPFARALIRLGLSLRRNAASSARPCANLAATPPSAAALSAISWSWSAARSTAWSAFVVIAWPGAPRRSRRARSWSPSCAPRALLPRRATHRDRSRPTYAASVEAYREAGSGKRRYGAYLFLVVCRESRVRSRRRSVRG